MVFCNCFIYSFFPVVHNNAAAFIQALLGGQGQEATAEKTTSPGGDIPGSLLNTIGGGGSKDPADDQDGLGIDDLLKAGMSFMESKQIGGSNAAAFINAVMSSRLLAQTEDRFQSG